MKTRLATMTALAIFAGACTKQEKVSDAEGDSPPPEEISTTPQSQEIPSPSPGAPRVAGPPATPAAPELAPPGVFYLVTSASVETASGVLGLPPGTQVVKQADGSYLANGQKVPLTSAQLTNDLRVARAAMAAHENAQNALRQRQEQQKQAQAAAQRAAAKSTPKPTPAKRAVARYTGPETPPPTRAPLGSSLSGAHERVKDGYVWRKNSAGEWEPVRPVR